MIKIVADDKIPFLKGILEPFAEVEYHKGSEISNEILKDADALIIRTRTKCNKVLLEGTKVKFIATATIGFDHIDAAYCKSNEIRWISATGCNSDSVKQYIASALTSLSIKHNFDLSEKTIGIVGHGNVGSKVANLAMLFGMKVLLNDPPLQRKDSTLKFTSLNEIKEKADIITFHVPLNREGIDKTLHMCNKVFLKSIKPTCIIINSSRGEVVDNQALKSALKNKQIKAAILDVWENEPNIDTELLRLVDYATPHIAGYSADGKANGTAMSVMAISDFFGFGLKNWFPNNVPLPDETEIKIDCKGKSAKEILSELILKTYDIQSDDKILKASVETFEKQRGDYPLRREFHNYTVALENDEFQLEKTIIKIGFKVKNNYLINS
jgi:erythronate-4-phosphate dehydrogenase